MEKEFLIIMGELTVPKAYLHNPIDYKYAILNTHGLEYEILYTALRNSVDGCRNRLLKTSHEMLKRCK